MMFKTLREALNEMRRPSRPGEEVKNQDSRWQALAYFLEQTSEHELDLDYVEGSEDDHPLWKQMFGISPKKEDK